MPNNTMHKGEQLDSLTAEIDTFLAKIENENRPMTSTDKAKLAAMENEAGQLEAALKEEKAVDDARARQLARKNYLETPPQRHPQPLEPTKLRRDSVGHSGAGLSFKNQATGETVHALTYGESLSSTLGDFGSYDDQHQCDIGETVVGMATGRMSEAAKLSVIGNSGTAGGYLLNPQMSSQVIDLARAASVCMKAGAQTIPMQTSEMILAKLDTDPSSYWRPEAASITASQPAFGRINLKAKTLGCLIPCSIELLEDSTNASEVITSAVQKSMASEIDRVILNGDGAESEPCGIANTTGVNTTTGVGAPGDYVEPTSAVSDILGSNFPGEISELAWLQHPGVAAVYDKLSDNTSANRRDPTPWAAALRRMYSTNLPNLEGESSDEYSDIYGYFPSVLVGLRTSGVVVEVLNSGTGTDANSKSVNAVSDMMRWIRCYCRLDVAVTQPSWFNVTSGITL